ncbi:MAG: hypothetical protein M1281_13210 [Chloroflexi bacterium]|nr:hypothetical protein [Chloroflexota bacterium]
MFPTNLISISLLAQIASGHEKVLAYLDPGSGSFLIQLLIGVGVGSLFLIKGYWSKIRKLLFKSPTPPAEVEESTTEEDEE